MRRFLFYFYFALILKLRHNVLWILRPRCTLSVYLVLLEVLRENIKNKTKNSNESKEKPDFQYNFSSSLWDFDRFGQGFGI